MNPIINIKRCKKTIANENKGFWACVEYLNTMEGGLADNVQRKLLRLVERNSWNTIKPFEELRWRRRSPRMIEDTLVNVDG
jgi:hypothetical protein